MFYLRAVKAGGDDRLSRHTNASPSGIIRAMAEVFKQRRKASANAIAAGVCFSIVALVGKDSSTVLQLSSLHTSFKLQ